MINSYMILERKTSLLVKIFLINVLIIFLLVIWGINTCYYQNYIKLHSKILYFDSYYFMEVLVPVKEVKQITGYNEIIIDSKKYNYDIYKFDFNIEYRNNINYQKVYLKIFNLDQTYLINGYEVDIKILKERKKLIDYLKNEKEEYL